jgi:hypothetical protein
MLRIAFVRFDEFNEVDSTVALNILNRVQRDDWSVASASPSPTVRSMDGLLIDAQQPLEFANEADVAALPRRSRTGRTLEVRISVSFQRSILWPGRSQRCGQFSSDPALIKPARRGCRDEPEHRDLAKSGTARCG